MSLLLAEAPDLRRTDVFAEIRRCAVLLRTIGALDAREWISDHAPEVGADLVTVVVPMFRAGPWIEDCMKGLLAQTHRNLEIFCVDDAGDDDAYERVVEGFGADRRLCVVQLARNVGPFQISNWVGARLARGRWIAWQDADNVSHPRRIGDQCVWMTAEGYVASSACAHHFFPPGIAPLRPDLPVLEADGLRHELFTYISSRVDLRREGVRIDTDERWRRAWRRNEVAGSDVAARVGPDIPCFVYRRRGVSHGLQMVEREVFRRFGGFSGRTKVSEDTDFDSRLTLFHDIGVLPRVLGSRRSHPASLTRDPATSHQSPARRSYEELSDRRYAEIVRALVDGDEPKARALAREELHHAEIEVRRAHLGFDVALS